MLVIPLFIYVYAILETQVVQFHTALLVNWSVAHFFTFSSTLYSQPIFLSLFPIPYSIIHTIYCLHMFLRKCFHWKRAQQIYCIYVHSIFLCYLIDLICMQICQNVSFNPVSCGHFKEDVSSRQPPYTTSWSHPGSRGDTAHAGWVGDHAVHG